MPCKVFCVDEIYMLYVQSQLLQPQEGNAVPKQRSTLDSLFANMKEQRMKIMSQQNNVAQRNGGALRRPPWARGQVGN